jgi:hypothetical protein
VDSMGTHGFHWVGMRWAGSVLKAMLTGGLGLGLPLCSRLGRFLEHVLGRFNRIQLNTCC